MGKKQKNLKSFSRRLTRWIVYTQLLVVGGAAYLIYAFAKDVIKQEELDLYKSYLTITNAKVGQILTGVSTATINHVPQIESSLSQPDNMFGIMKEVVSQNSHIRSCGISFIADYYPNKGHRFCPYAVRDTLGNVKVYNDASVRHDYLKAPWYLEALEASEAYWSKPFFSANDTLKPSVSYLVPIRDKQGKTVAILGADMSLDWFRGEIFGANHYINQDDTIRFYINNGHHPDDSLDESSSSIFEDRKWRFVSYNFIIDDDGTFVAHPNPRIVLKQNYFDRAKETTDTIDDYVGHQMVAGKKGTYKNDKDDIDYFEFFDVEFFSTYMFYEPIEHTNWSLAIVVPRLMVDGSSIAFGIVLLILIGLGLLVLRIVARIIIRRTTKSLKQLAVSANEVAKGNFMASLPKIKHNDEIRLLRDSFEDMQHSLTDYMEELKTTTASKASIENELKIAHDIQMSMLPKKFPPYPERSDIDIYGTLIPAKAVGGDLFDFHIRDEMLFFCIGDVSGKGVPASLVMAVARSLFRNVSAYVFSPETIITAISQALAEGNESNMFVTLFIGVLNLTTGHLSYCNAGHNAPLIIDKNGCQMLPCDANIPGGVMSQWTFSKQEVMLEPQTTIFLYTDGLSEAEDMFHDQFQMERVHKVMGDLQSRHITQAEAVVQKMSEAVHTFVGGAEQSDDLTMLAIRYLP